MILLNEKKREISAIYVCEVWYVSNGNGSNRSFVHCTLEFGTLNNELWRLLVVGEVK